MLSSVEYARASDDVPIAYSVTGSGPVLVWLDVPWFSHLQKAPADGALSRLLARLAQVVQVVRIDTRGSGASGRDASNFTLEQLAADVIAVVDRMGVEQFSVFARDASGPIAVELAAAHPARVEHLILYASWLRGADVGIHTLINAFGAVADVDWHQYSIALTRVILGVGDSVAEEAAAYFRECVDAPVWKRALEAVQQFDATARAATVRCPSLVLYPDGGGMLAPVESSRDIAARLPRARLVALPGTGIPFGGAARTGQAIAEFLGVDSPISTQASRDVYVILFTDIEGHALMMSRLGDGRGRTVLREHERRTRLALTEHGGREVKSLGDGVLATFSSAGRALDCARALQRSFREPVAGEQLRIRVGINAGEPIAEDGDLFGRSVIAASRITGQASGGQVLVANVVRELTMGGGYAFRDAGERHLKGLSDKPVQLWELIVD